MSEIEKYGNSQEEQRISNAVKSRQIVQEILNFGVTQIQIAKITYLLALELEDREHMLSLSACAQQILNSNSQDGSGIIS